MNIKEIHDDENFDCPLCKNEWYVLKEIDGRRYACPCECREERLFIKSLKAGGIKVSEIKTKTLENFKVGVYWQQDMLNVANKFLANPQHGVGFFGKSGTGKTHICFGIMAKLMEQGKRCVYFPYRNYIRRMVDKMFNDEQGYIDDMKKFSECDVLYIDDLFKLMTNRDGTANKQEIQIIYELINNRYTNRKLTIFSSEFNTHGMEQFDEAVASRIYSMCDCGYYCKEEFKNQRYERRLY